MFRPGMSGSLEAKSLVIGHAASSADLTDAAACSFQAIQVIYRAATDGSVCLRYPVLAFPVLNIRNLIGARGWSAIIKFMVRRMR